MTGKTVIEGGDTFARTLREFGDKLNDMTDANRDAGEAVAAATRNRSRRRTGRLAASFTVTVTVDGATVGSDLDYAGVQEFGWRRHNITPSYALTGAFDQTQDQLEDIYADSVESALSHVKGK